MRKERPFRRFRFENYEDGMPTRMVWLGDFVRGRKIDYITCPRCNSPRLVDHRCLDCWADLRPTDDDWIQVNP